MNLSYIDIYNTFEIKIQQVLSSKSDQISNLKIISIFVAILVFFPILISEFLFRKELKVSTLDG